MHESGGGWLYNISGFIERLAWEKQLQTWFFTEYSMWARLVQDKYDLRSWDNYQWRRGTSHFWGDPFALLRSGLNILLSG